MSEEVKKEQEQEVLNSEQNTPDVETAGDEKGKKDRKRRHEKLNENEEKLQELGQKLVEANDKYVRIYSEYENYRKRTTQEKADLLINGARETVKAILPVVDDLERALSVMADDDHSKEGVQLIYNKMMSILQQKGLRLIEAKGEKFDENLHEAVTQFPAADENMKGTVVDVVEKGYFLNDKVLRYAKVVVAI